ARNDSITVHAMPRPGASLAKQKEKITRTNLRMLTKTHEQGRVIRRFRTAKRGEEKPAFSRENQRYFVQTKRGAISNACSHEIRGEHDRACTRVHVFGNHCDASWPKA